MFALLPGPMPVVPSRARVARLAAFAAFLGLAGCASAPDARTAQTVTARTVADAGDVEADGLPAQTPPPARVRLAPDDPNEPFSRNYGGSNPSAVGKDEPQEYYEPVPAVPVPAVRVPVPANAMMPPLPDDLPEEFRRKLVHAMAETDE